MPPVAKVMVTATKAAGIQEQDQTGEQGAQRTDAHR
jgi:hypothetical protein